MCVWVTRSAVLLILVITRFSIHGTKLPLKVEITNTENALNIWRKNAQVLTPIIMMPKISRYYRKCRISFSTIRCDISISKTIYRYIDISIYRVITITRTSGVYTTNSHNLTLNVLFIGLTKPSCYP